LENNNLLNLDAKEVISPEYLKDYEDGMGFFYSELVTLNTNIFIINKIREFPFDVFCAPDDKIFFSMVINNFFEYSIIIISRLIKDTSANSFTIRKFKNRIIKDYIKPEYREAFKNRIKNSKFEHIMNDILDRIQDLRNKRIAHTIEDYVKDTKNIGRINFKELEKLRDFINLFFENLSFNIEHMMVPVPYSDKVQHPKDSDPRSDIEKILDSIAKESAFLNAPEINSKWPTVWKEIKKRMTERELNIFNKYREKLRFPKIEMSNEDQFKIKNEN